MRTRLGCLTVVAIVETSVLGLVHPVASARAATRIGSSATVRFEVSANVISHCEVAAPDAILPRRIQTAAVQRAVPAPFIASCASGIPPVIALRTAPALAPALSAHAAQRNVTIEGRSLAILTVTY